MQSPEPSPLSQLGSILIDIERCVSLKLYYPALLISLTLPEICTALTVENSVFIKEKHYAQFVDKYASGLRLGLTGIECYRLRGGVVHRANMAGHPFIGVSHVIFTLPETGNSVHAMSMEIKDSTPPKRAAMLDLVMFCRAMVGAVHVWYRDHYNHPMVIKNMKNLIRYCPEGLAPFLGGAPVVASGE